MIDGIECGIACDIDLQACSRRAAYFYVFYRMKASVLLARCPHHYIQPFVEENHSIEEISLDEYLVAQVMDV